MRVSQVAGALLAILSFVHAESQASLQSQCAIDPESIVSDACSSYSDLNRLNHDLSPGILDLTQNTDFFAYYRLNLFNKVCPFWSDESSMCGNRACAVDTIDDEQDIPPIWRAEELSKLEGMRAKHPGRELQKERPKKRPLQYQLGENVDETCVLEDDDECDARDYCLPEDEGAAAKGDYVSLVNNTERFTGYSGPGPHQVWDAIYKENCFSQPIRRRTPSLRQAASALQNVMQEASPLDDECLEQRAFYRIISGMHTSISTHLCWDYFNQKTGEWFHNVTCYKDRLHDQPERVSNLYFNYALLTRAVVKLQKHLEHYTFCSGDPDQDYETKHKVLALASRASAEPNTFDESVMFTTPELLDLKDSFKQRFRNVSRLMDCVGCDKCRLWGKVQTAGYGAALKVLFEFDETKNGENPALRRTELVALINTWGRVSHSLNAIDKFREMVQKEGIDGPQSQTEETNTGPMSQWIPPHTPGYTSKPESFEDVKPTEEREFDKSKEATSHPNIAAPHDPENSDDDFDDLEEDPYSKPETLSQTTIMEDIYAEVDLVWRAYKMVLSSWVELPFKISGIAIMELSRLWNFFVGLPVPERSWRLDWSVGVPRRDEL